MLNSITHCLLALAKAGARGMPSYTKPQYLPTSVGGEGRPCQAGPLMVLFSTSMRIRELDVGVDCVRGLEGLPLWDCSTH